MTLRLNPTCAVRLDPVYEYGPELINEETGETYREITGIKPGVHIEIHERTIQAHPALAWGFIDPDHPVHDPGSLIRTWAATEEAYKAAAPVTGSPYDLFVEVPDED
jgi:hypothetical protein